VRDSRIDKHISNDPSINLHTTSVSIQELREAERQFHQRQDSSERRSNAVQQRRVYAVAVRRITPQLIRRTRDDVRDKYQRSRSTPR